MLVQGGALGTLIWEMAALLVYGNALIFAHELGHALFARAGGFRVTSFGVGSGRPLARLPLRGGAIFYIGRLWIGGACHAVPTGPMTRRRFWFHSGGLLVQGLIALLLFPFTDTWIIARIAQFNLLVAATNIIPWKWQGTASDGWYLLDTLSGGRRETDLLTMRPILVRLSQRQRAVKSPLGQFYASMCLAWSDLIAYQPEKASPFFDSDPPQSSLEPWFDVLFHYTQSEWHRQLGRPLAALQTIRNTHLTRAGELDAQAIGLLALAEARALVDLQANGQARQVLGRVVGLSGPTARQAAVIHLWTWMDTPVSKERVWLTKQVSRFAEQTLLDRMDTVFALLQAAKRLEDSHGEVANHARRAAFRITKALMSSLPPIGKDRLRMELRNQLPSTHLVPSLLVTTQPGE